MTEVWYNPNHPIVKWYHCGGCADLDDPVFKEFLQQKGLRQTSPSPAKPRQPSNLTVNPLRCLG